MSDNVQLFTGDCLDVLKTLPDNSFDSIVTDPPYGLSFMGKKWDYDVPSQAIWEECLRVLKPGGHLLSFAGTRTQHRMAVRIEDAGFELRDMMTMLYDTENVFRQFIDTLLPEQIKLFSQVLSVDALIAWIYGSGFPKSHNLKGDWEGWGTALKPALEPITVARKPFKGTVAANVLIHGTGALNIDACRVPADANDDGVKRARKTGSTDTVGSFGFHRIGASEHNALGNSGRWPANVIHDGSKGVMALFPENAGAVAPVKGTEPSAASTGQVLQMRKRVATIHHGDQGSAARFFYCAKASPSERHRGLLNPGPQFKHGATLRQVENTTTSGNDHPTVKPVKLMLYLIRLITPPGGHVLDPFTGSGSTGVSAVEGGFAFTGIEREPHYMDITRARIGHALQEAECTS
ncbi:DNA-methyltransferase [Leclercia adecarboxylata]|uniref:DNA-methyltransferase n=1 Tax=Leclercia adecarboxylata TaxID=83655 RepID=UPI0020FFFB6E|nr:site-specific DNA-methyltransferase [Leclercia adecarboxylata]